MRSLRPSRPRCERPAWSTNARRGSMTISVYRAPCLHGPRALIFADLSNCTSYGEQLLETFRPRVIGVHIARHGNGMKVERRPAGRGSLTVYHVGRSNLLEAPHSALRAGRIVFADGPEARRAYAQLEALEPGMRERGTPYVSSKPIRSMPAPSGVLYYSNADVSRLIVPGKPPVRDHRFSEPIVGWENRPK